MSSHLIAVHHLFIILAAANLSHQSPAIMGISAKPDEASFMAALTMHGEQFCGGSIISDRWILTAAHCLYGMEASNIQVAVGKNKVHSLAQTDLHDVEMGVMHENFDYRSGGGPHDVGLLKLVKPLNISKRNNVSTIDLAQSWSNRWVGQKAKAYGWGLTSTDWVPSNQLLSAELEIKSDEVCRKVSHRYSTPEIMCAGGTDGTACIGDSGGPLVLCSDTECAQVGITSFGESEGYHCLLEPSFFTRVPTYVDWIERTIKNNQ